MKETPGFPVWRTVMLGTKKSAEEYLAMLARENLRVSDWAVAMLDHPSFECERWPASIDLVKVSVSDLGFTEHHPCFNVIRMRAEELRLGLCPPEVGPLLRVAYRDQPRSEWLTVAMKPIRTKDGEGLFVVMNGPLGPWLYGASGDGYRWKLEHYLVFTAPKETKKIRHTIVPDV